VLAAVGAAVGLLATAALAARPGGESSMSFRGRTAQGITVRLGPRRAFRRAFRYQARMRCSDGSTFLDRAFTDDVTVRRNRFSSRFSSSGGAVLTRVTGVLRPPRARGTIRIIERYSEIPDPHGDTPLSPDGGILCDSRVVRWTARAPHSR
jgi:hypothetical protein